MRRVKILCPALISLLSLFLLSSCVGCNSANQDSAGVGDDKSDDSRKLAKFEPADGKCYIFIGQDMGAIGGLEEYDEGYCDSFETPAGITVYFGLKPESTNNGLFNKSNWGSGDCYADFQAKDPRFEKCMIAVGMSMVHQEENILEGKCNATLDLYADWFKSLAPRPVFLRVGYEFDGYDWNFYEKDSYKACFRYIKDYLDAKGVENVAYVWQSVGFGTSLEELALWYPGEEYVDWCAYSHFGRPDTNMIKFAEARHKPVFIAEATPIFQTGENSFDEGKTTIPAQADKMWSEWFTPLFSRLETHPSIKAISYINVDWYTQEMWITNPTFQKVDSRIQASPYLSKKWVEKMSDSRYVNLKEYIEM